MTDIGFSFAPNDHIVLRIPHQVFLPGVPNRGGL